MKSYFIQTFGCQMNQADSEKVHMVFLQSGFMRAKSIQEADVVVFNTCSVRQKGEDRVFGIIRDLSRATHKKPLIAITGCMVRKTGIAKKYLLETLPNPLLQGDVKSQKSKKRKTAKKIEYLDSQEGIFNYEDKLFPRSEHIDFVFRIEETRFLPHILTHIYGEKIGQEDKYDDYLKQVQQRENPFSASVIIQTGCDNYCSFCIVPYTRGGEVSRSQEEILSECESAVKNGAKEITLLGQNVNSYGKQSRKNLWNSDASSWKKLKIWVDLDDTLFVVMSEELIETYNRKYNDIVTISDIRTFNCWGIENLMHEYHIFETRNAQNLEVHLWGEEVLKKLKKSGHHFYVITSREVSAKTDTLILLEKYFWKDFFEEIIFLHESGHDHKYTAANQLGLDIVIDDGPHHFREYSQNFSGNIFLFSAPWNADIQVDNMKSFRVEDWYEFDSIIQREILKTPFRKLLEGVNEIDWLDRIRFTSSNPHDMTHDILHAHFDLKKSCNYLHFALQSGSNSMLKKMNRRHSYEDFKAMVDFLRSQDPLFSISTDIIVGFSGETDEMFEETVKAFKELEFDFAYIARYSVRPNTLAAKLMPDDVPDSVKAERWHILNNLLLENIGKRNQLMLGRTEEVLISGEKDEQFFGRTRNFKEVFFKKSPDLQVGDIVQVRITDLDRYVLRGELT
jgi:tRNA A37 methylthiotransferase MiaB